MKEKIVENFIISKENFKEYFKSKRIISKEEYIKYLNNKLKTNVIIK